MNELRGIYRYDLVAKEAAKYVKEQLDCANILSTELTRTINFESGNFFTLLPKEADFEKLYNFYEGGILPQNEMKTYINEQGGVSSYTKIPSLKDEMGEYIYRKMMLMKQCACLFEEVQSELGDTHLDFYHEHGKYYEKQLVYYIYKSEASSEIIARAIREINAFWHLLFVLCDKDETDRSIKNITPDIIQDACQKTKLLVVGAYDSEGFVLWEPSK